MLIIEPLSLVLLEHRELNAEDCQELSKFEAQAHRREHVDFHQRLTPHKVSPQAGGHTP